MTAPTDGTLPIDPPLVLERADAIAWDQRVDVLVAGFGAAGSAAAIEAHERGAKVLIVDRFEGGGATQRSGGIIYAGGGTRHQRGFGYEDTPEAMAAYLRLECGDAVSDATLKTFCRDSRGLLEWLESIGARFDSSVDPPKTSYPKDGIYLYYSGNETVPAYAAVARPAPRGHRVRAKGMSGIQLFALLKDKVEALRIPVQRQSAVRRLITHAKGGAVLGAEVRVFPEGSPAAAEHLKLMRRAETLHNFSQRRADALRARALALEQTATVPRRIRATGGVILATGGFIFNRAMVAGHAPKYAMTMRLGTTGCDGSGIRLGESAGGVPRRMDKVSAWRFINPPSPWPQGIVVDGHGRRFCNEQVYGAKLGVEMCEAHEGRGWLVLDASLRRAAMKEAAFGGLWFFQSVPALLLMLFAPRGKTLAGLAARVGLPAAALESSVHEYNDAARNARPDPLGKSETFVTPLRKGPYFALDISAGSKTFPCPAITLGGLAVDESSGHVVDARGAGIRGLYAAGRAAVGLASNGYVSGLSLADCLWSGKRAGRDAAESSSPTAVGAAEAAVA